MRKFYRKDNKMMGNLLWESPSMEMEMEPEYGAGVDPSMDFDEPEAEMSVMEIEPTEPVEMSFEEINEVLVSDLKKLAEYAERLQGMSQTADFDDWMVAKITKASDYVSDVWHRLDAQADFANTGFEQSDDYEVNF